MNVAGTWYTKEHKLCKLSKNIGPVKTSKNSPMGVSEKQNVLVELDKLLTCKSFRAHNYNYYVVITKKSVAHTSNVRVETKYYVGWRRGGISDIK